MVIIKDSYANYENKPAPPALHNINGGYAVDTTNRWRKDTMNNAAQFLKMQLFRAALPDLHKVVAQRNPLALDNGKHPHTGRDVSNCDRYTEEIWTENQENNRGSPSR